MATTSHIAIVAAIVLAALALWKSSYADVKSESFSLGNLLGKVVGVGKDVGQHAANLGKAAWAASQPPAAPPPPSGPTYTTRQWDGADWSCPDGTVDSGLDPARACITSQFTSPQWRWDGKQWGWSCPNGTLPTGQSDWNSQCVVGYTTRVLMDGKWQCPYGTYDTGANWGTSDYYSAMKQCQRHQAYGTRMWDGSKWACPPGTTDTGRSWNSPVGGANQCKFNGG